MYIIWLYPQGNNVDLSTFCMAQLKLFNHWTETNQTVRPLDGNTFDVSTSGVRNEFDLLPRLDVQPLGGHMCNWCNMITPCITEFKAWRKSSPVCSGVSGSCSAVQLVMRCLSNSFPSASLAHLLRHASQYHSSRASRSSRSSRPASFANNCITG